ncbi:MAG: adenine phosphoribosyltransferase [Ignavibacteriae bacterium HGW-Ignavibacteriae-4]|nr:MAG: adenine phosphoribosyltransferase [Ignavibacteriae bacterium HGW-Ignavibacteriae-4]
MNLKDYIRDIPDFPKPGILFRDITPLLDNPEANKQATLSLIDLAKDLKIDKVIGIESRGFFFGTLIAEKLNAGFVPVRKPNKLPFDILSQEFQLEYGTDRLEIHKDAISKGDRVLVHDDVLATGGTAEAACKLVEELGGEVVQCNFLIELSFLKGRDKLSKYNIGSLINY